MPPLHDDQVLAFDMAPVGLLVSRQRVIQSYNQAFSAMFGHAPEALAGQPLAQLYPSVEEYRHIGERAFAAMRDSGVYADDRIMRRADGRLFWCHVSGRAIDRSDPFDKAVWVFEDLSAARPVSTGFTPREREIAPLLIAGKSNKEIAQVLQTSPRTVESHRARMMRKLGVATAAELVARLLSLP
jgi:PAS domain S-box-containing protein